MIDFYFYAPFKENWKDSSLNCFVVLLIIFERSLFCSSVISYKRQYLPTIRRTFFEVIPDLRDKYPASPCNGRMKLVD